MEKSLLNFFPVLERTDLVPTAIANAVKSWSGPQLQSEFWVAEIDPDFAGGIELCNKYQVDPKNGANCLIVEGKRGTMKTLVACLVPVGYKYDMSGVVKRRLNVRQVSVASLEYVLSVTKMEYGSITPIGIPEDWKVFIDPLVLSSERIIIGGGLKKSKLSIPSEALLSLPGAEVVEGLAKKEV